jgi:hypothetical protein
MTSKIRNAKEFGTDFSMMKQFFIATLAGTLVSA